EPADASPPGWIDAEARIRGEIDVHVAPLRAGGLADEHRLFVDLHELLHHVRALALSEYRLDQFAPRHRAAEHGLHSFLNLRVLEGHADENGLAPVVPARLQHEPRGRTANEVAQAVDSFAPGTDGLSFD